MLLVWRMRQDIELQRTRVTVNAVIAAATADDDKDAAYKELDKTWKGYLEDLLPFERGRMHTQDQMAVDYLKQEVAKGPLKITPLQSLNKPTSRLRRRLDKSAEKQTARRRPIGRRRRI